MKILALGIGNVMFGDEGVGVHFMKMMSENYEFSSPEHTLTFLDGGTMANHLTPIIADYEYLIVCDCIDANGGLVGDVYFFDFEDAPNAIKWSGSAHEIEMLQTLQMMDLLGDRPKTKIIGVIPKRIEPMSFELSSELQNAVPTMSKVFLKELSELGFTCDKKADYSIADIAKKWQEKQF